MFEIFNVLKHKWYETEVGWDIYVLHGLATIVRIMYIHCPLGNSLCHVMRPITVLFNCQLIYKSPLHMALPHDYWQNRYQNWTERLWAAVLVNLFSFTAFSVELWLQFLQVIKPIAMQALLVMQCKEESLIIWRRDCIITSTN